MKVKRNKCLTCDIEFDHNTRSIQCCSAECKRAYKNILNRRSKYENKILGEDYVECKICGFLGASLAIHLKKHKINTEEYRSKYSAETACKNYLNKLSVAFSGENNPAWQHGGKLSPYSKNFLHKDRYDPSELAKKAAETSKKNGSNSTNIEYYLKRGYTQDEAEAALKERQTTFTIEKCIKKYGKEEGERIWHERQEKWQNTLNSKSPEEIERINRAKVSFNGYSKLSQELFKSIHEQLGDVKVYYATNGGTDKNSDYCYISNKKKVFFFDFYVPASNKIIEFDGDYWHGEKRGNQQRDRERDKRLIDDGFIILRIPEKDYNNDKKGTVAKCLNFLML